MHDMFAQQKADSEMHINTAENLVELLGKGDPVRVGRIHLTDEHTETLRGALEAYINWKATHVALMQEGMEEAEKGIKFYEAKEQQADLG